ncbi:MAG: hypothetical protein ACE367_19230 [Acidimicrobiales bacterium]
MDKFAKKIHANCADDLHPGEQVAAAAYVQPPGVLLPTILITAVPLAIGAVFLGAIGGAIGAAIGFIAAQALASKLVSRGAGEGMAAAVPGGNAVLAVTDRRLLVFGHNTMSGKPQGLQAQYTLDQVHSIAVTKGKMTGSLAVTFADGSTSSFDVAKTAKPEPFVAAFQQLTGR